MSNFLLKSSLVQINKLESEYETYFNPSYFESIVDYKMSKKEKNKISIIGTSRGSGFEKDMFSSKKVFNYSMIINSLKDIFSLAKDLGLRKSDTLILSIDQWEFNMNYKDGVYNKYQKKIIKNHELFFIKKKRFKNTILIGDRAIKNFSGFRDDGSYFQGKKFLTPNKKLKDYKFKETFRRIEKGIERFEYGGEVDENKFYMMEEFINYWEKKGIVVIGFFPPYAPSVVEKLFSKDYNFSYIKKSSKKLNQIFQKYNYTFVDLTYIDKFNDSYFIDSFHCNRNVYFDILKKLGVSINKDFDNHFNISESELSNMEDYFRNSPKK